MFPAVFGALAVCRPGGDGAVGEAWSKGSQLEGGDSAWQEKFGKPRVLLLVQNWAKARGCYRHV